MILSIDSATHAASCALVQDDGSVLASSFLHSGLTHSQTLLPMISNMWQTAGEQHVSQIVVTNGPGSFTGLRIGVAEALGLAAAWDVPVVGVSTLRACAETQQAESGKPIWVCLDARRGQYYSGCFRRRDGALVQIRPDEARNREEILTSVRVETLFAGDAAHHFADGGEVSRQPHVTAVGAAWAALARYTRTAAEIVYLRKPMSGN